MAEPISPKFTGFTRSSSFNTDSFGADFFAMGRVQSQ